LTVESYDEETIVFALAAETLAVTNWQSPSGPSDLVGRRINLERSLKMGDRIHGHWVTGHVDAAAKVTKVDELPGMRVIDVEIPKAIRPMVWKKGSWAINGVSLTVNSVDGGVASHCLIPETLSRTNLSDLKPGDLVNVEVDVFARALAQSVERYLKENVNTRREQ
jgi:riboflavin synthase